MNRTLLFIVLSMVFTSSYSQSLKQIADSMNIRVNETSSIANDSLNFAQWDDALVMFSTAEPSSVERCLNTYSSITEQATSKYGEPVLVHIDNYEEKVRYQTSDSVYLYIRKTVGATCTFIMYTL